MSRAALRYAKAVLDLALVKGEAAQVNEDMSQIVHTLSENPELETFVNNATVATSVKHKALLEIFASANSFTQGLFRLLEENKRFEILGDVAKGYNVLFEDYNGTEKVIVTTAVPLDEAMEAKVMSRVLEFTNKKVVIENVVDPAIIGGFILRIGDRQFNGSVANKLKTLQREFKN